MFTQSNHREKKEKKTSILQQHTIKKSPHQELLMGLLLDVSIAQK
jgi:hypothetical protein